MDLELVIKGNTQASSNILRKDDHCWRIVPDCPDGGVVIYEPHGYHYNIGLDGFSTLLAWLQSWLTHRREQFKPLGFNLTSMLTGEVRECKDLRIEIIGDSFILRDSTGGQVGEALSGGDWTITPILPAQA